MIDFIIIYYSNNLQAYLNSQPCRLCFDINSNSYFKKIKKKIITNPNKNSTKAIKWREKTL